jgi:anti-sigma regulatory factor (Ser/Thr protein kinase)
VRHVLRQWNLSVLNDTAELVVSELTTNAVKATGSIERLRYSDWGQLTTIMVCVYRQGRKVVIEVWDRDKRPPVRKEPSADDENGRGLLLVEMLCSNWGYRWPTGGGKIVWAELTAD